jgi:hypothetical protein
MLFRIPVIEVYDFDQNENYCYNGGNFRGYNRKNDPHHDLDTNNIMGQIMIGASEVSFVYASRFGTVIHHVDGKVENLLFVKIYDEVENKSGAFPALKDELERKIRENPCLSYREDFNPNGI